MTSAGLGAAALLALAMAPLAGLSSTGCSGKTEGTGEDPDGGKDGSSRGGGTNGGTNGATTDDDNLTGPAKACVDTAKAIARAGQRCGADYDQTYQDFVDSAAGGDCTNVKQIRDEQELRNQCIVSLELASCQDLGDGKIDDSCKDQLRS